MATYQKKEIWQQVLDSVNSEHFWHSNNTSDTAQTQTTNTRIKKNVIMKWLCIKKGNMARDMLTWGNNFSKKWHASTCLILWQVKIKNIMQLVKASPLLVSHICKISHAREVCKTSLRRQTQILRLLQKVTSTTCLILELAKIKNKKNHTTS